MFKKRPADPTSKRGLIASGLFFLGVGTGLGYYLLHSAPVGADPTPAHVVIMTGVILAGVCWIGALSKNRY